MANEDILIIDDEPDNIFLTRLQLEKAGYEVITSSDPQEGLELVNQELPDLIILDINMPGMDGLEVCKKLKSSTKTAQIPIIMFTSRDEVDDRVAGLDTGADDYLDKETDFRELKARVESNLRSSQRDISVNPLTKLPGNRTIKQKLKDAISEGRPVSVGYVDLDNFKVFNDTFGFDKGDEIIKLVADLLREGLEKHDRKDDFIGHIGGDDFVFISRPPKDLKIAEFIVEGVEEGVKQFYPEEVLEKGEYRAEGRDGDVKTFGLVTLTVAITRNAHNFESPDKIADAASSLKKKIKDKGGNDYGIISA